MSRTGNSEASPGDGDQPLPGELQMAIDRARQRRVTTAMQDQVHARLLRLPHDRSPVDVAPKGRHRSIAWILTAAAAILCLFAIRFAGSPVPEVVSPHRTVRQPNYSAVRKVSLVHVAFRRVAEDLDEAESRAEVASESLVLAAVRREIEDTLEEHYEMKD